MYNKIYLIVPIFISILSIVVGFKGEYEDLWANDEDSVVKTISDYNCDTQLDIFEQAFYTREEWALRLFDTWGKFPSGIFQENQYSLGHFTECLNFQHDLKPNNNEKIQGQYCLTSLRAREDLVLPEDNMTFFESRQIAQLIKKQSLTIYNGICLPASCSQQKVLDFTNKILQRVDLVSFATRCQIGGSKFEEIVILPIVIYTTFGMLVIVSTLYDLLIKRRKTDPNKLFIIFSAYTNVMLMVCDPNKLFIIFSAYTNGKQLFNINKNKSPNAINCLLGLRSMSLLWIIYGHRFILGRRFTNSNKIATEGHYNRLYKPIENSYDTAVDTFLTLGGLLVVTSSLKVLDKRFTNYPKMILHRYIRYTPSVAAVVLFAAFLMKYVYDSPYLTTIHDRQVNRCSEYWWSALLHIQNYVNPFNRCNDPSWYLSVDFQLFIISPFLIYPAWKYGWKYLWSLLALAVASSIYVLTMCLVYGITVYRTSQEANTIYTKFIYQPTHARMGPWLVGMVLGYVLHTTKSRNITIGWKLNSILWFLSITIITLQLVGGHVLVEPSNQILVLANALYIAFHRLVWSCAIFWIIFACEKLKTGGFVRWFLSLPEWQPIARLSLSMYLIHLYYIFLMASNAKEVISYEIWPQFHLYLGDILAVSMFGTILYLTFEAPFILIEKYVYDWFDRKNEILIK